MSDRRLRPLRQRLVAVIATLILATTGIVVTVSTIVIATSLNDELDTRLQLSLSSAYTSLDQSVSSTSELSTFDVDQIPSVLPGSFHVIVVDGAVTSSLVLDENFESRPLSPDEADRVLADLSSFGQRWGQLDMGGGRVYRIASIEVNFDDSKPASKSWYVVGVAENPNSTIVTVFLFSALGTALAATGVAAFAGYRIVAAATRPLEHVAELSDTVASTLASGDITMSDRVPEADLTGGSETQRVGLALNRLLDTVESSLAARQRAEESLRRFVADASHELRNPLASIRGYAEHFGAADGVPAEVRSAMARISSESLRLGTLVNELLTLAKLDAGRTLADAEVDLSRLLIESVEDARMAYPDHDWRIALPPEPVVARGDELALRQVLVNLCSNAGTHTPAGTTVTATAGFDGDSVHAEVRDSGPGIGDDVLPHIFERFSQGAPAVQPRARKTGSSGLGLAIVWAITVASGGRVVVDSEPGDTAFRIELPRFESGPAAEERGQR